MHIADMLNHVLCSCKAILALPAALRLSTVDQLRDVAVMYIGDMELEIGEASVADVLPFAFCVEADVAGGLLRWALGWFDGLG